MSRRTRAALTLAAVTVVALLGLTWQMALINYWAIGKHRSQEHNNPYRWLEPRASIHRQKGGGELEGDCCTGTFSFRVPRG